MNYKVMRLFYFGNETNKSLVYFKVVLPLLEQYLCPQSYFVKRDWNGGPNYKVVFEEQPFAEVAFYEAYIEKVKKDYAVTNKEIDKNIEGYHKMGGDLATVENANLLPIDKNNHMRLTIEAYDNHEIKKLYNSKGHFELQTKSLMRLQKFINQDGDKIHHLPMQSKYLLYLQLMLHVLRYSEIEDKYSVMVYLSNSEGILAMAANYGKRESLEQSFNLLYESIPMERIKEPEDSMLSIQLWKELFDEINEDITEFIQLNELYEENYYSKEAQHEQLAQNISQINSRFHNHLLANDLSTVTSHKLHQQFRFLINIEYQILHMLGITFKEKAFLCYALPRFILTEAETTWEEILTERRLTIET